MLLACYIAYFLGTKTKQQNGVQKLQPLSFCLQTPTTKESRNLYKFYPQHHGMLLAGRGAGNTTPQKHPPSSFSKQIDDHPSKKNRENENELKKKMKREREDDKKKRYRVQEKELKPWL